MGPSLRSTFIAVCLAALGLPAQVISTVAGTTWVFPAGSQPALSAPLGQIEGVAADAAGNIYIADPSNNVVVKISPDGTLVTVAGNGIQGFSGDGGIATSATLNSPTGIALDPAGNLYIAEVNGNRIRKVDMTGVITTLAGTGSNGFSGDGSAATKATLNSPSGIAVDGNGNVYFADTANQRIRKVNAAGNISTIAGTGASGYSGDNGPAANAVLNLSIIYCNLALDAAGNLYFGDGGNNRIRKIDTSGVITTIAGTGTGGYSGDSGSAISAQIRQPAGIALDTGGNLYFCDLGNGRLRRIDAKGIITTIAGNGGFDLAGDGGPALSASFSGPFGVALDVAGNLYVSDSFSRRLREISAGIINTIAGNGLFQGLGDGGPATSAALSSPNQVKADSTGNLYIADSFNNRIRKVNAQGIITTIAGAVLPGNLGDGGPAVNARLNRPYSLALDSTGNIYIADTFNSAIRKIAPSGTISTFFKGLNQPFGVATDGAGNVYVSDTANQRILRITPAGVSTTIAGTGTAGFSGDGGPATSATLNMPEGLAVDSSGNVYVADTFNSRVRKITASSGVISTITASLFDPTDVALDSAGNLYIADTSNALIKMVNASGTLTTIVGGGTSAGLGDGGPPSNASLSEPSGIALDAAGNLYIADTGHNRIRAVPVARPAFAASPASLQFSLAAGAAPATSAIALTSTVPGLTWTAVTTTQSGGSWLSVVSAAGVIPGNVTVSVNPGSLTAGMYQGSVTVTSPLASPPTQAIAVTLNVTTAVAAQLQVAPGALRFSIAAGSGAPSVQNISISNSGGGSLAWTAQTATGSGGNWLTLSSASGTATPTAESSVSVTASAATLAAGVYSGTVTVKGAGQTSTVQVTLSVTAQKQTILLSRDSLLFTAVEGGSAIPSESVGVVNIGQGTMTWTAAASTISGGNWLSVTPGSGSSVANSLTVPLVQADVNVTGMKAGQYGGQIKIAAAGANNSPQFVTVILNLLPAGSNPGVLVRPTGLIFVATAGSADPGSQNVTMSSAALGSTQYASGLLTFNGNWAQAIPESGTFSAAASRSVVVQPAIAKLATGIYRGALTLLFSDGSPAQVVDLLLLVVGPGSGVTAEDRRAEAAGCTPTQLLEVSRTLSSNFVSPASYPTQLEVQVVDDCGTSRTDATVIATFSTPDAPVVLASLGTGVYSGTWRPATPSAQIVVTLRASVPSMTPTVITIQGGVGTNITAASVGSGGVVNAASFDKSEVLAPGSIVSVFGSGMTTSSTPAIGSTIPLPTTLTGATITIGGIAAPLYYTSSGQINTQIPFELGTNAQTQVVLRTGGVFAAPETITIDAARPGIFVASGTQGVVVTPSNQLVDSTHPATAGDVVVVYCTGLGVANPPVATNQPSPVPAAVAAIQPTATIGGVSAPVQFAGMSPGLIGLYQVNIQIPAGVAPGPTVPLVLTQSGVSSNLVTMGIH
jgi:uncharacterized protein (TIGR03437 family)